MPVNLLTVEKALGLINPGMAALAGIISMIKGISAAAKAANPTAPDGTFPTDAELIERVLTEAGLLKAEAGALRAWLATQG